MNIVLSVMMIVFCCVYIIDVSGVTNSLNKTAYKIIYGADKHYDGEWYIPVLSCAKCASFWMVLLFTLCSGIGFVLSVFTACMASLSAVVLSLALKRILRFVNKYLS